MKPERSFREALLGELHASASDWIILGICCGLSAILGWWCAQ
jgi:hypothetical protein